MPVGQLLAVLEPRLAASAEPLDSLIAISLAPGGWDPPDLLARRGLVLYVLDGVLLRSRGGTVGIAFAGDAIRMDADDSARWRVLTPAPARVALVGPTTASALATIPGAAHALMHAVLRQVEREQELRSIVGIQRIEERIVAFFDLLGRRAGVPAEGAVRIPLVLKQKRIEEILSAGHTQATSAFRTLYRSGVLVHDAAGWLFTPAAWRPRGSIPNLPVASIGSGPNSIVVAALASLPL